MAVSVVLTKWVAVHGVVAYLPGNWPAPFGIALSVDLLSGVMLTVSWMLGLAAYVFASARWHRAGVHFHPLFQLSSWGSPAHL